MTISDAVTRKAEEFARRREHECATTSGKTVCWGFQHLDAVAPLLDVEIGEGTEDYWEFYEKVDKKGSGGAKE